MPSTAEAWFAALARAQQTPRSIVDIRPEAGEGAPSTDASDPFGLPGPFK